MLVLDYDLSEFNLDSELDFTGRRGVEYAKTWKRIRR